MTMQSDQTERLIVSTTTDLEKAGKTVDASKEVFDAKREEQRKCGGVVNTARRRHENEMGADDFDNSKEDKLFEKLERANDALRNARDATCEAFKVYRWDVRQAQLLYSNLGHLNRNLEELRAKGLAS